MSSQKIYTVGGTVQASGGLYIKRKTDDELLELCRQGEFAFILSSRQIGKSSLMVRTAQQLEKENIYSVTVDLSAIGVNVAVDEWYLGILNEIHSSLNLETDIFAWWKQFAQLGPAQRLIYFFKEVLLKEVKAQVVLFFDEIDSTLSIPFSDDFYIAIRAVYNARSTTPEFKRLSFVLVGVATPGDLISDNKRTPFNIGRRVEINDFTVAEALPLAEGLGEQAAQVLTWVFQYTGGHPYLTQRLCAYLANSKETLNQQAVINAVQRFFTGEQGKQDNNLQFVRDMLSVRSPDVRRVLKTYKEIRAGKIVSDDERSPTQAHLKLSGLVRSEKGALRVRNEIYNSAFDLQWIQENTPKNWQKAALISLSAVLGILILGTLSIFVNDYFVGSRIDKRFRSFISASSPEQRLSDLAEIYSEGGILSNQDSEFIASDLFYGLSSAEDQLALFRVNGLHENPKLQNDLIVVISHLYITVANVDPEENNTELLQAMHAALDGISQNPNAADLEKEIAAWLDGRKNVADGNYEAALVSYHNAIALSSGNPATLYERAKVNIDLEHYTEALTDLEATIEKAKQAAPELPATSVPTVSSISESSTPQGAPVQTANTSTPSTQVTSPATSINTTSALELTLMPPLIPTAVNTFTPPPKYESNFTTLIDIVNAVQAVIENTPPLQQAIQSNAEGAYTNLQSVGLVRPYALGIGSTISGRDGMLLVYVPAGAFIMGDDNSSNENQKPAHTVYLDTFWIDQTEVTLRMYYRCVEAGTCGEPPEKSSSSHSSYYGNPEFDNYPVIHVDWNMAQAYCEWVDRRLPTEAEWEKAARGENSYIYPWGNAEPNSNLLNYNNNLGDSTPVGQYPRGASPYGALDMAGNVSEWVFDWYSSDYYRQSPVSNPRGPNSGAEHVIRGGSWAHDNSNFTVTSEFRFWNPPEAHNHFDGFRCARSQ